MGNERWKAGKYFYLCLAVLIVQVSCAHGPGREAGRPHQTTTGRWEHLQPVRQSIEKKDFEGAIREYQQALASPARTSEGDLALFDLGLLYAYPENPGRDHRKALACFTRLLREHPRSSLRTEARIWADVLETLERAKQVDLELDEKQKPLTK